MSEKKDRGTEVPKTGHIYDGIEELDHGVPNWFNALFVISIIFAGGYYFYYSMAGGPTLVQEYERTKSAEEYSQYQRLAQTGGARALSDDDLKVFVKDPAKQKVGLAVFQSKCASCHGGQGQGGIGPNLTDKYWLHGGKMSEVLTTITKGVPEKGMPPWGPMLSAEEIQSVTAYIRALFGSNPAGAKAQQGTLVESE